jgi:carboxyl-terminal processing protease
VLEKFKSNGKSQLILDIRDNGGGYMDVLCEVAGMLVEKESNGQVVSITIDKYGKEKYFNSKNQTYNEYGFKKIVVLANEHTASASEILIGAMLDYDKSNRVSIVLDGHQKNGQTVYKTYGKGIMQTTYANLDSSAVKLTTAKMFWPKSRISIHDKGVTTQTSNKVYNATNGDAYLYALNMLK